ncbi:endonuclease/exonuclease/phosphatase family protein [Roseivivax isoporae]|uniref:Endonuclease n=1 Tax=Roseivivax isoporae LMG 25204 TaxID=1449351 RepID=X7FCW9_9RHOB|nr:endonuclease/exonuclease/phosphatase family protein [Roseivivax isoporae]ETX30757.1 endonuclease [Roseivivax isoporae LMG 25204]
MRLATWNVEWFDALFDDDGKLLPGDAPSRRHGVSRAEQASAVAHVLNALDADAVLVVEAPDTGSRRSTRLALEGFADRHDLRQRAALIGFANETQQEIALLHDPTRIVARHDPRASAEAPRFDGRFAMDLDIDAAPEDVSFSKPPLEVALSRPDGSTLPRLIGVHLKSKAPHGARGPDDVMRLSIANRRKQLAQAVWLRARIDDHLAAGEPLIVAGDLNDGPGLDAFEALFGRSSIEIVRGAGAGVLHDPHAEAAMQGRFGARATTARFYIAEERRYLQALLDYLFVSPELVPVARGWRIWHPFDDPECWHDVPLRAALLAASDHYPVTLDLDL